MISENIPEPKDAFRALRKPEAKWQTSWTNYLKEVKELYLRGKTTHNPFGYYELKQAERNSISFGKIETHQYDGLQITEEEGMVWKFSDDDGREKPCDCACLPPLPSYIVIHFPSGYYVIGIKKIVEIRENGGVGITLEKAKEIADKIVILG